MTKNACPYRGAAIDIFAAAKMLQKAKKATLEAFLLEPYESAAHVTVYCGAQYNVKMHDQ